MRIGTAGWSIPRETAPTFPAAGHQLQRYAQVLGCVEVNSSFYRSHRTEVYARWAALTPPGFRFAVKLPRTITHDARLRRARAGLAGFLAETAGLGPRLGVILVQLPPSLVLEPAQVRRFFGVLAELMAGLQTTTPRPAVVCEPRHISWFTPAADRLMADLQVCRAAADPARCPQALEPGGWLGPEGDGRGAVLYHRWHGSPRMYWSRYTPGWLEDRAQALRQWPAGAEHWCIFDNTAMGAALPNALELQALWER